VGLAGVLLLPACSEEVDERSQDRPSVSTAASDGPGSSLSGRIVFDNFQDIWSSTRTARDSGASPDHPGPNSTRRCRPKVASSRIEPNPTNIPNSGSRIENRAVPTQSP
jgi:hypothetical protein